MLKENFISATPDEESSAKVSLLDNNKTLIVDQFTDDVEYGSPELFEKAKSLNDVFNHFKPKVDVDFLDDEGNSISETLQFNELRDFETEGGKGKLITNSPFLSNVKAKVDINTKIKKKIEQSKKLREILKDKQSKEELKIMLKSLLEELK
jgi:hypothetical protein